MRLHLQKGRVDIIDPPSLLYQNAFFVMSKVALVTGASSGLNKMVALELSAVGFKVFYWKQAYSLCVIRPIC